MARVIGIFSGKGGSGKTTLAINLASVLSRNYNKDVTLVDCNLTTSHVGLHLGMYNYHVSLNHVLRDEYDIHDAVYSHHSGMKVVPSSVPMADIKNVDIGKLTNIVKKLSKTNDIVILDAPPGLGREAISTLKAAQDILYVTNPHLPAVIDVIRCQSVAAETGANPLGIALNMVFNDKSEMKKHEIEYLAELPVIASVPYDKHVRHSLAMKAPVVITKPNSPASKEIHRLAARIVEGDYAEDVTFMRFLKSKMRFW